MNKLRLLFLALFPFFPAAFAAPAVAAPAIVGTPAQITGSIVDGGSPDLSSSCTLHASANLLLVGLVIDHGTRTFTGLTWDGAALSLVTPKVGHTGNGTSNEFWYLLNPSTGTHNLLGEFSSVNATGVAGGCFGISGAALTSTFTGTDWDEFSATGSSSLPIACPAGALAFDMIGSTSSANFVVNDDNIEVLETDNSTTNTAAFSTQDGAGATTMAWLADASETGVHLATCINALVAGGQIVSDG